MIPVSSHGASKGDRPIVVWNSTLSYNLNRIHCYANAVRGANPDELLTEEAEVFIDNLAGFKVPVLLFSGGEQYERYKNSCHNSGGEQD